MRITIVNGEPTAGSDFDRYVGQVERELAAGGHEVSRLDLRELDIKGCTGCWACWAKTPGQCVSRDDSEQVCRAAVASDLTLFASPLTMGFTTALLKRAQDKFLPIILPYTEIEGGELHHVPRYAHYPLMGLLLGTGADTDAEDIEITTAMWARTARNMKTRLAFTVVADRSSREVAHEITAAA